MLKIATQALRHPKTLYIFVDSQATIKKLRGLSETAQQTKALCRALYLQGFTVHVIWCPSHQGIYGNELADYLAKKGLKLTPTSKPTISYSHLARKARKTTTDGWQYLWAAVDDLALRGYGTLYRLLAGNQPKISLKFKAFSDNRAFQTAYIQLKTGVGSLKSHLRRIRKTTDSVYWCCGL